MVTQKDDVLSQTLAEQWQAALSMHFAPVFAAEYSELLARHRMDPHDGAVDVTEDRLREMGIRIGHRRRLKASMNACAARIVENDGGVPPLSATAATDGDAGAVPSASSPATLQQSFVLSALERTAMSGTMSQSRMVLPDGSTWIDIEGSAVTMDEFVEFVRDRLLSYKGARLFPPSFFHAFSGRKPLPYAKHVHLGGSFCSMAVLRTPKKKDIVAGRSTIRSLTDLFVVLVRIDPVRETALVISVHRQLASDLSWLRQFRKDVETATKEHPSTPTYNQLIGQLFRSIAVSGSSALDNIRLRTDALSSIRLSHQPKTVVEEFFLRGRQAQSLRRTMAGNMRVLESWRDHVELNLQEDLADAIEAARALNEIAAEVEGVAVGGMDVRVGLVGFRAQENMKLFTYLSVITQPLTLATGWYGMNFPGMPEFQHESLGYKCFLAAIVALLVIMVAALHWFTKEDAPRQGEEEEEATEPRAVQSPRYRAIPSSPKAARQEEFPSTTATLLPTESSRTDYAVDFEGKGGSRNVRLSYGTLR